MAKFKKKKVKPTAEPPSSKEQLPPKAGADRPADIKKTPAEEAPTGDTPPAGDTPVADIPPADDIPQAVSSTPEGGFEAPSSRKKRERILSDTEAAITKGKMDRLFWMRVILAVIAGTAATFMFESIEDVEEKRWTSIGFMIIVFIGTVIVAKMMRIRLASSDRKKLVTNGLGSFVFLYLFVWILSYTLVYSVGSGGGIVTPIT